MRSDNIYLRALEPEDIDYLYTWENDENVWEISSTVTPYSKYILRQYIENSHLDIYEAKQMRFIISDTQTNTPIGTIDLFDFDPRNMRVGIGILIYNTENRGKGYATEALRLVIKYCFEMLSVHQVYCNILEGNDKSISLFEKLDFKCIGVKKDWILRHKKWYDEFMYQLVNDPK